MINLKTLDDKTLLDKTTELVKEERKITLQVLHHLREIERRRLYFSLGFTSLFDYCVKHLTYSEASAQRRIVSMRLLKELPEIEEKIEKGSLSLSVVAQAQSFFKKEEKQEANEKLDILKRLDGKSTREAERELLSLSSKPEAHLKERKRQLSVSHTEMSFYADEELKDLLEQVRGLLAHSKGSLSTTELIREMSKIAVAKLSPAREPLRKRSNTQVQQSVSAQKVTRAVPAGLKRLIWQRDEGKCTYIDPRGKRCNSRYALEPDHYPIPFATGGQTTAENLRLVCRSHNMLHAVQVYGIRKMSEYWGHRKEFVVP